MCTLLAIGIFRLGKTSKEWLPASNAQKGMHFGMVFDVSSINTSTISTPTGSGTKAPRSILPAVPVRTINDPASACHILITSRLKDYHYEILESIALQYPIDWERNPKALGCRKSTRNSTASTPIVVDFLLDFKLKGYSNSTEAWGWKDYFEKHLQGNIVQRHARFRTDTFDKHGNVSFDEDQRWIFFRRIVDATPGTVIDWAAYDFNIEANCGFFKNWERRLKQDITRNYCVLHSSNPKKVAEMKLEPQVCNLNPQHAPRCWFLPSDLPKFPPPNTPSISSLSNGTSIPVRICIGWKANQDQRGRVIMEHRDTGLVAQALETLRPKNVQIAVIGRDARIPKRIQAAKDISHYVVLESSHTAFYDYQHTICQCHVMVPLIHPNGASADYFRQKGKLSGMITQTIGNGIPALVHSAVADIYRDLFTAPIFEYNETENPSSFILAFQRMLDFYAHKTTEWENNVVVVKQ